MRASSSFGVSEGWMNAARSVGVNRAISARQLAKSDAGTTSSEARAPPRFFSADNSARTWIVLPSPMSSARHAPSPRLDNSHNQPRPVSWYGRKVPRSASPSWTCARFSGLRGRPAPGPASCRHGRKTTGARRPRRRRRPDPCGAPASRRMPSMNEIPPSWACSSTFFQWSSASRSFWRSTSTHCPRRSTRPSSAAINSRHSDWLSCWSPSTSCTWKSSIASASNLPCFFSPMLTSTRGRGRFFHQSGRRTSTPLSSRTGTSLRNL